MTNAPPRMNPPQSRLARLQSYLDSDPDNFQLLADVADEAIPAGQLDVARSAIQHALELSPRDPFFRLRLSSVAIAEGNFDDAMAITAELLADGAMDWPVRFNHAFALLHVGRYAEAKEWLENLYREEAPAPTVIYLLVRSCHYLGQLESAIALALRHLELHPDDHRLVGMLSLLYFDADDLNNASLWSQRALASGGATVDALVAAGGVALAAEDASSARDLMNQAIGLEPRSGRAWTNLGLASLLQGQLDSAREALNRSVRYMPQHIGTRVALGWVQLLQGDLAAAETTFRDALAVDDNFGETHGGLAAVAAMRGDWDGADAFAKVARRLTPSSLSPYFSEIIRLHRDGKSEAANDLMKRALKRGHSPGGGTLLDMVARLKGIDRR